MKEKKTEVCGFEPIEPKLTDVSCPTCGMVIGKGGYLDVRDPCFDHTWDKTDDYVAIKGVRIDRNGVLCPRHYVGTNCDRCALDRREKASMWEGVERRKEVK